MSRSTYIWSNYIRGIVSVLEMIRCIVERICINYNSITVKNTNTTWLFEMYVLRWFEGCVCENCGYYLSHLYMGKCFLQYVRMCEMIVWWRFWWNVETKICTCADFGKYVMLDMFDGAGHYTCEHSFLDVTKKWL
jgi:hypothetical protein